MNTLPQRLAIVVLFTLITSCHVHAATFDLLNRGLGLDEPHSITVDGITLRLSGGGDYNSSPTTFGIDSEFFTPDDPLLIDLNETLFFVFNQDVRIDSITISQFDAADAGGILFKQAGIELPLQNGLMEFGGLRLFKNGSDRIYVALGGPAGNNKGFSLDRIVVRPIPEPATLLLTACGCAILAMLRRRV